MSRATAGKIITANQVRHQERLNLPIIQAAVELPSSRVPSKSKTTEIVACMSRNYTARLLAKGLLRSALFSGIVPLNG
jgi:hypothetical protein